MNHNNKYTTFEEIFSRVTSLIKHKTVNPADVLEWCVQCETEWIQHSSSPVPYLKVKLDVIDKSAYVPSHCIRILDVFSSPENEKSHVNYYYNGSYLVLDSNYDKDFVYINFIGIAVDEKGIPFIKKGNEEACVHYVICNLYYEDYLSGKLDPGRWREMKEERNLQIRAAQSVMTDMDRLELRKILMIKMNMVPKINFDTLYHKTIGT